MIRESEREMRSGAIPASEKPAGRHSKTSGQAARSEERVGRGLQRPPLSGLSRGGAASTGYLVRRQHIQVTHA